jgi:hypothetical protein
MNSIYPVKACAAMTLGHCLIGIQRALLRTNHTVVKRLAQKNVKQLNAPRSANVLPLYRPRHIFLQQAQNSETRFGAVRSVRGQNLIRFGTRSATCSNKKGGPLRPPLLNQCLFIFSCCCAAGIRPLPPGKSARPGLVGWLLCRLSAHL